MTTQKTERSVEIITDQHMQGRGIEVYASGDGAHGSVIANITHKRNGAVVFGFAIDLYFRSEFINNPDGSPDMRFDGEYGSLQVLQANTWLAGADRTDYVDYKLGDEDRNIIIPALKLAILKRLAETGAKTNFTNPPRSYSATVMDLPSSVAFGEAVVNVDWSRSDHYIYAEDGTFRCDELEVITKDIKAVVSIRGFYNVNETKAVYVDGVLITPKVDEVHEGSVELDDDGIYYNEISYHDSNTPTRFTLTEDEEVAFMQIIANQVRLTYTTRAYPLGETYRLSA